MSSTRISGRIKAPTEAVYRACSDPQQLVHWRMPENMAARLLDANGATYRMSLSYEDGRVDTFEATFIERVPPERIVERIRFAAPNRAGDMTMTTTLRPVEAGTEVTVVCENLPAGIEPQDNEEGSRQALARLARWLEGFRRNL
jgi:uncharacterized protein YndB with AHSA1/START domain